MKITDFLSAWHTPKKGRTPQPVDKVPFQEILPLKLKDRVSGKSDQSKGNSLFNLKSSKFYPFFYKIY